MPTIRISPPRLASYGHFGRQFFKVQKSSYDILYPFKYHFTHRARALAIQWRSHFGPGCFLAVACPCTLYNDAKQPIYVATTERDITGRKQLERQEV